MTLAHLAKVGVMGPISVYAIAEDALSALKVMEVVRVHKSDAYFLIDGWLLETWVDELAELLDLGSGGLIVVARDETAASARVDAPSALENPAVARPFEYLTELFALPGRSGYDPTLATFAILPLFIGFIIGDVGHGLLLVGAGAWIRWRFRTPTARLASTILLLGGAWALAFGAVVFAEVFSFHFAIAPLHVPLLDKVSDIQTLLVVSILIGVAHVALGLGIGFVYERRRSGLRAAVLKKLSWMILEVGLVILALGLAGVFAPPLRAAGLGLVALAIVILAFGGGLVDVIEIPSFVSNILSYLRLGALGVADSLFGASINEAVLGIAGSGGVVGSALGFLTLALLHGLLVGLAVFFAALHALRLHYVEFYTKFYRLDELAGAHAFHPAPPVTPP